jgi:hypothetical protein
MWEVINLQTLQFEIGRSEETNRAEKSLPSVKEMLRGVCPKLAEGLSATWFTVE